jgi:uncharacterized protein YkwD
MRFKDTGPGIGVRVVTCGRAADLGNMSPRSRLTTALACIAVAALCGAAPASATYCPDAETLASEQTVVQIEESLRCLINERRAEAGLAAVRRESRLRDAAQRHSEDMVSRGYFAHDTPSGVSFIDRITATGYTRGASTWLVGENLVWGSYSLSTPAAMTQAWMDSPAHRANLMRSRFRELGISAVRGTPYDASDLEGITVSTEYGMRKDRNRTGRKSARAAKKRAARRSRNR